MRIELVEHASNGIFGQLLLINTVHIETGDGHLRHLQFAKLLNVDVAEIVLRMKTVRAKQGEQ